jgi:hypothetical protein
MNDLHAGRPVLSLGPPLGTGSGVVIMLHGRGAGAENILELVPLLDRPQFTYLAPAAAGNTWYPYSFMSAIERKRAVPVVRARPDRHTPVRDRRARHPEIARRAARVLAGGVSRGRIRRAGTPAATAPW